MRIKVAPLLAALVLLSPCAATAYQRPEAGQSYTVQVASFEDATQAKQLITRLARIGQKATAATVDLPDRGRWTRVLVGTYVSDAQARAHANRLMSAGLIREFLIRSERNSLKDTVRSKSFEPQSHLSAPTSLSMAKSAVSRIVPVKTAEGDRSPARFSPSLRSEPRSNAELPVAPKASLVLAIGSKVRVPGPDPVRLAFLMIAGRTRSAGAGGLWLTGNTSEGLERLRWIAGPDGASLVAIEPDGHVTLDPILLKKAARIDQFPVSEAPLVLTDFIYSNEGLLLLVQLAQSRHRYRLHIAQRAPTRGAAVEVVGGINLDDNFDSRINPHRRMGKKLDNELPPDGFDSLVAINPVARWFNQKTNQVVPAGHITFHELAEAHAKLELGLDYLGASDTPGAHEVALQRELRLKAQRPLSGVVVTAGSNRVLRSDQEAREFFSRPLDSRP